MIILCLYALASLFDVEHTLNALAFSARLLYQLSPVLLLVFMLIFLSNLLVKPNWVQANLGRDSGVRGWVLAVFGGILSVGPVYTWFVVLRDLKTKGMRSALIAVFLYNRGIKLPLLPFMIHYFGAT